VLRGRSVGCALGGGVFFFFALFVGRLVFDVELRRQKPSDQQAQSVWAPREFMSHAVNANLLLLLSPSCGPAAVVENRQRSL
jgi:hypothetical protein